MRVPNDPTRTGSEPPDWAADLVLSCSEITALATKAARGAGLSWGEAEEAGWACGCLARAGLPGPAMILRVLERGAVPSVCPLRRGIMLMDHAGLPEGPGARPLVLREVVEPLVMLPFLVRVAGQLGVGVVLRLGAREIRVRGLEPVPEFGHLRPLCGQDAGEVVIELADQGEGTAVGVFDGRMSRKVWQALDALALRTTVPASEVSRQRAGAASSDND